jgi:hypothetical protein
MLARVQSDSDIHRNITYVTKKQSLLCLVTVHLVNMRTRDHDINYQCCVLKVVLKLVVLRRHCWVFERGLVLTGLASEAALVGESGVGEGVAHYLDFYLLEDYKG